MGKTSSVLRRSASMLAVAIAMMAITGPASADELLTDWNILNGKAGSEALNIKLTLPAEVAAAIPAQVSEAIATLNGTIEDTGLQVSDVSGGVIQQSVALSQAEVLRADDTVTEDKAEGHALPLQGLINTSPVTTKCIQPACPTASSEAAAMSKDLGELDLGDLGSIEVAGAKSKSQTMVDTRNSTALAKVRLGLQPLLDSEDTAETLDELHSTLNMVVDTVNETIFEDATIQGAIADLRDALDDTPAGAEALSLLDQFIAVGPIDEVPDLRDVDLLNLTVLGSSADVYPSSQGSEPGLLAKSASKVADVDILGGWATIDAVGLSTSSFANGVAGEAAAQSDVQLAGVNLGGLLKIDVPEQALADLANFENIENKLEAAVADQPQAVQDAAGTVIAVARLLYNIAGIDVQLFEETTEVADNGLAAKADAGTLKLTVAPQTPVVPTDDAGVPDAEALVAQILTDDVQYTPTGLILEVTLPNAHSAVKLGDVLGKTFQAGNPFVLPGRTGVGTPLLIGVLLLGMAVVVRRFAMTK